MLNIPEVKLGIVAVSRDCFPESLSVNRRKALVEAYKAKYSEADIYECPICIVESEIHMVQALEDIKKAGCNALCVYLGNFGPEISETLLAKHFDGPKMFCAAAEESQNDLVQGRGDAYCGMLNASYNLKLRVSCRRRRGLRGHDPRFPSCRESSYRTVRTQDHLLRSQAHELPCVQRADQAALQPRR